MTPVKPRHSVAVLLSGREKFSAYYGGALARWTYEVYSRLTEQIECMVFSYPTKKEDLYPLSHETSRAWWWCNVSSKIPRVRRYEEQFWLRALLGRLHTFDAIHIHNRPQWVGFLRSFGYRGRIILHLHNDHLGHWQGTALDALAPKLDRLIVCSHYLRNTFYRRSSALGAKADVVLNGVNMDIFYPQECVREPKTILFVGRFDQEKGVLQLVQAYAQVLQEHPEAQLVIGGTTGFGVHTETAYVQQVRRLTSDLIREKHARVQFTGYLHHDRDLPKWFQRATIFASPSIFQEPFGLVNAEAMACATPVVGASRGGIPEVLGTTGCLIDPENIGQFADALSKLLSQPDYRMQLGRLTYQRCREMFNWNIIASHWGRSLEDICN